MKAILLAGGFGTRLFPLTLRIPKVMVPVGGKPVMQHLVEICRNAGVEEVIISLNPGQAMVEEYFGDGMKFGVKISYVYEKASSDEEKLGAIGAIKHVVDSRGAQGEWLIIGGDNVFYGLDLRKLEHEHAQSKAFASLVLYELRDTKDVEQYGVVELDANGRIRSMQEKPKVSEALSSLASTAVYRVGESFLKEYLPRYVEQSRAAGRKADRLGDLWAKFATELPLYGHAFRGMWGDANTPKTYVETNKQAMMFNTCELGDVECRVVDGHTVKIAPGAQIHPEATIKGPCIIGEGCVVESGAVVGRGTHLMKGCVLEQGAIVYGSILFEGVKVGQGARLTDCVIDTKSSIGPYASVEPYSMLGLMSSLGERARLLSESRLWPFVQIGGNSIVSGDVMLADHVLGQKLHTGK